MSSKAKAPKVAKAPPKEKKDKPPKEKKPPKERADGTTYRWTEEEHSRFLEGIALHGFDLTKIAQHVETRDFTQVKSHAQKYFDKPENAAAKEALVKERAEKKAAAQAAKAAAKEKAAQERAERKAAWPSGRAENGIEVTKSTIVQVDHAKEYPDRSQRAQVRRDRPMLPPEPATKKRRMQGPKNAIDHNQKAIDSMEKQGDLSDIEKKRLANMYRNQEFLASLAS